MPEGCMLNLEAVNHVDLNGAKALARLAAAVEDRGVTVALARVRRSQRSKNQLPRRKLWPSSVT